MVNEAFTRIVKNINAWAETDTTKNVFFYRVLYFVWPNQLSSRPSSGAMGIFHWDVFYVAYYRPGLPEIRKTKTCKLKINIWWSKIIN